MDGLPTSKRVNGAMLQQNIGKVVRLVGEVINSTPDSAQIKASDGQQVSITKSTTTGPFPSLYVEVIGKVQPDGSVLEYAFSPWGQKFDMQNYESLLATTQKYPDLFGTE